MGRLMHVTMLGWKIGDSQNTLEHYQYMENLVSAIMNEVQYHEVCLVARDEYTSVNFHLF